MKDTGLVAATEFLRHPLMVGSAFSATARMVPRMLGPVDWSNVKVAVEYGPGSGRFTFAMLERLGANAQLIARLARSSSKSCAPRPTIRD